MADDGYILAGNQKRQTPSGASCWLKRDKRRSAMGLRSVTRIDKYILTIRLTSLPLNLSQPQNWSQCSVASSRPAEILLTWAPVLG